MRRKACIDLSGALHHLMIRAIERKRIFRNDQDRSNFLDRLGMILVESKTSGYAWALLSNRMKELGMRETEVARRLKLTRPAVCNLVRRGEHIAEEKGSDILPLSPSPRGKRND